MIMLFPLQDWFHVAFQTRSQGNFDRVWDIFPTPEMHLNGVGGRVWIEQGQILMLFDIEEQASSGFASASRCKAQLSCDEINFTKQNRLPYEFVV